METYLTPVQYVKGVGPHRAALLARLGISTVRDALFHLPARYEDRSALKSIAQAVPNEVVTIKGWVTHATLVSPSRRNPRLKVLEVAIADETGSVTVRWFNQPYLIGQFPIGRRIIMHGTVRSDFRSRGKFFTGGVGLELVNHEFEFVDEGGDDTAQVHTDRIVPIYPLTDGLSQKQMRTIMRGILAQAVNQIDDPMPQEIISRHRLPALKESIETLHFPSDPSMLPVLNTNRSSFHERLAFDELFALQVGLAAIKRNEALRQGISFRPAGRLEERLRSILPFELTAAQERVLKEFSTDMASAQPMHRLLQGDVGSGKTIVALFAMTAAVECGYQAALMVPTEILAEQHFFTIHRLAEDLGLRVTLLTGGRRNRDMAAIESGDAQIIVGTHALIQEAVTFNRLGLIVIDEQHRFGVMQRALVRKKGTNPDILVMTATPIPRTLALTLYGDLDYSIIDELPPGRSPIITMQIPREQWRKVVDLIKEQTGHGRQVYVVYPVIEESEKTDLRDAVSGRERLQQHFPNLTIGLIHGKMKPMEREDSMAAFTRGELKVLVATTVIEVGVDVPNATLMVIIHAERFGLAQLHQLRGRVGRGSSKSYCLLVPYGLTEEAKRRLSVMIETTDGFKIAEEDLSIRGPGEFFGVRQSGMPDLKVADLVRDTKLLQTARQEAFGLIGSDPSLSGYPRLRRSMESFWGGRLELFKTA